MNFPKYDNLPSYKIKRSNDDKLVARHQNINPILNNRSLQATRGNYANQANIKINSNLDRTITNAPPSSVYIFSKRGPNAMINKTDMFYNHVMIE